MDQVHKLSLITAYIGISSQTSMNVFDRFQANKSDVRFVVVQRTSLW